MKPNEAQDIIAIVVAAVKGAPDAGKRMFWEQQLIGLDADQATQAALLGIRTWEFFPAWKEFASIFQSLSRLGEAEQERKTRQELYGQPVSKELPPFVKRWICARYLYKRFDHDAPDMRPFREMAEHVDPTGEFMPDDAWVTEAATMKQGELWNVLQGVFAGA